MTIKTNLLTPLKISKFLKTIAQIQIQFQLVLRKIHSWFTVEYSLLIHKIQGWLLHSEFKLVDKIFWILSLVENKILIILTNDSLVIQLIHRNLEIDIQAKNEEIILIKFYLLLYRHYLISNQLVSLFIHLGKIDLQ